MMSKWNKPDRATFPGISWMASGLISRVLTEKVALGRITDYTLETAKFR